MKLGAIPAMAIKAGPSSSQEPQDHVSGCPAGGTSRHLFWQLQALHLQCPGVMLVGCGGPTVRPKESRWCRCTSVGLLLGKKVLALKDAADLLAYSLEVPLREA